jgi:hypothetical protein
MPEDHKKYTQWNAARFIFWGESVGPNTAITVKAILSFCKVESRAAGLQELYGPSEAGRQVLTATI